MKKNITILLLLLCIAVSCERDDICPEDTATTPRMIIEFRDIILSDNTSNVTNLRIEDVDDATRVVSNDDVDYDGSTTNTDQIIIPLKTTADDFGNYETKYRIYSEYEIDDNDTPDDETDDIQTGNDDIIIIQYSTTEVYVSRACGYKTIFNNVQVIIEQDTDNWMLFTAPENDNQSVTNEDEVHFTIRH